MLKGQSFAGLARSPPLRFARQPGAGEVFFKEINATSRHFDVKGGRAGLPRSPQTDLLRFARQAAAQQLFKKKKKKEDELDLRGQLCLAKICSWEKVEENSVKAGIGLF